MSLSEGYCDRAYANKIISWARKASRSCPSYASYFAAVQKYARNAGTNELYGYANDIYRIVASRPAKEPVHYYKPMNVNGIFRYYDMGKYLMNQDAFRNQTIMARQPNGTFSFIGTKPNFEALAGRGMLHQFLQDNTIDPGHAI